MSLLKYSLLTLCLTVTPALAETRALYIKHAHTKEEEKIVFKRDGRYDAAGLKKLNWMLRDWRNDQPREMDPELFDIIFELYRAVGATEMIHVVSAFRSEGTNAMLRRRSRGVARNSQHIQGKALDFHIPGVTTASIREAALKLERGGVGFYPRAGTAFIHVDSGSVRHWPKMTREQLARVFPDGKTVHIPRDGKPLAGFDFALAKLESRGGSFSRALASRAGSEDDREETSGDGGRLIAFLRSGQRQTTLVSQAQARPISVPRLETIEKEEVDKAVDEKPAVLANAKPLVVLAPIKVASFIAPLPLPAPREREMMRSNLEKTKLTAVPLPQARVEPPSPFKTASESQTLILDNVPLPQSDPRGYRPVQAASLKLETIKADSVKTASIKAEPIKPEGVKKEIVMKSTSFGKPFNSFNQSSLSGNMGFGFKPKN